MNPQRPYRQQPGRTAALLLLVLIFSATALIASGTFDETADLSNGSTQILTPDEAAAQAANDTGRSGSAALALLALLLLVGGVLLVQFALPSRRERRRALRGEAPGAPRRMPSPGTDPDTDATLVLAPVPALPERGRQKFCRCGAQIDTPLVLHDPARPAVPEVSRPQVPDPASGDPPRRRVGARIGHLASVRISQVASISDRS